jgi:hypothetical protein
MKLILCIIAAEAMTQLVCKAEIFNRPRNWFRNLCTFTQELINCPYCVSVWIAAFTTILYFYYSTLYLFIVFLVIHRISNLLHDLFRIIFNVKLDQYLRRRNDSGINQ